MIILDATTKSLELKLSGAISSNQLPFYATYSDHTTSTYTGGESDGTSNNATAVTVVGAPGASTQRLVKYFNVYNADNASATVTIQINNNGTLRILCVITLAVGDTLVYTDINGFEVINTSGQKKSIASVGTALPAGTNHIGYVGHGKTIKTASGSLTADTDIVAAVASKRIKVIAYSLISSGTSANIVLFKSNGTGGTELWRVLLQSSASIAAGANLSISAPSFLFATVAGEKLTVDVNQTDTVHYSVTYFDDDTA